ncbi:MAG TPA: isochorismate synthase, partial [Candidatus Dormibacteraeota bacterium]
MTSLPQPDATRPDSSAVRFPTLVARTIAIDDPGALLSLLPETSGPDQMTAWVRRGEGLVGWGRALELRVSGLERFARAQSWWRSVVGHAVVRDDLVLPGTGPVAFGSFSFAAG